MKPGRAVRGNGVRNQAAGAECPGSFFYLEGAVPRNEAG
jgi:hypothetical protein